MTKSKAKKVLASLLAFGACALPVLAEGETAKTYADAITDTQTALTAALGSIGTAAVAIVVAGIAVWLIPRVVGALKSAFTSGKGR